MKLEAVWFKNGKEVYHVSPVMNMVCYDEMKNISEIEIENGYEWYSSEDFDGDADDFVIRVVRD